MWEINTRKEIKCLSITEEEERILSQKDRKREKCQTETSSGKERCVKQMELVRTDSYRSKKDWTIIDGHA